MYPSLNPTIVTGRADWPEIARLASKAGFPAVDLNAARAQAAGLAATREALAALKVQPAVVSFPVEFRRDEATFESTLAQLEPAAQFGVALGCPRMATYIVPSAELPYREQRALFLKRLRRVADILARSHVRLGLEFVSPVHLRKRLPYPFIYDLTAMLDFAGDCGPNVGLLLDSWHWYHAGNTVKDILNTPGDRLVHIHINDAAAQAPEDVRDNERLMPGEGKIDLMGFLQAIQKTGYRDAVSVEVFGRGLKDMPVDAAVQLAFDTTAAVMRKAQVWN
jgi:sugar phosphate isomerase/epimerase